MATHCTKEIPVNDKLFTKAQRKQFGLCDAIMAERARQDAKFGEQNHNPFTYLAILGEEVGEANKAAIDACDLKTGAFTTEILNNYRDELLQVAAVAMAAIEALDRGLWPGAPITEEFVQNAIDKNIEDGILEQCGTNEQGEPTYRMTEKARKEADAAFGKTKQ
jgi:NTP pyrophosphatase (non-canonical NTP hydrolase)